MRTTLTIKSRTFTSAEEQSTGRQSACAEYIRGPPRCELHARVEFNSTMLELSFCANAPSLYM